jgi:hypothetical protein
MAETGQGHGPRSITGWSVDTYAAHNEAIRAAEQKFQEERDRRYAEVATEREKALKIKETADLAALGLAREIQTYKDEKANQLRDQINNERGLYAQKSDLVAAVEKIEAQIQPVLGYMAREQGKGSGISLAWSVLIAAVTVLLALYAFSSRAVQAPPVYYAPMVPGTLAPVPVPPLPK